MNIYDPKNGLVHIVKGVPWDRKNDGLLYYFMCGGDLVDIQRCMQPTLPGGVPTCLRCLSAV